MQVRMLKNTTYQSRYLTVGDDIIVDLATATRWVTRGIATNIDPFPVTDVQAALDAIAVVDAKVDSAEAVLSAVDAKVDTVDGKVDTVGGKVDTVDAKATSISAATGTANDSYFHETIRGRVEAAYQHVHKEARVAPSKNTGVTVTSSATAWTLGDFSADIIAANSVGATYDLHWVNVESMDTNGIYEIVFYAGNDEIARVRTSRQDNFTKREALFVESPWIGDGVALRAKVAHSVGSAACVVSVGYHTYSA